VTKIYKTNYFLNLKLLKLINLKKIEKYFLGKVNKEKASKLWKMIQEAGDYLQG
jgi:hypothetical protein